MADTTNIGNIEFDLNLDTKGLQRGAKKAESIMSRLDQHFHRLASLNEASDLFQRTGKAVFDFGRQFIDAAAQIERFRAGLTSVTGSAAEADRQLKRLREVAKLPGLGFPEAVEGSTNLQAAGFSAGQAEESLRAFGNALASVGKGKAELDGVILALSQMAAKGKLSAEEINQIAERVPQIRQVMKDAFGTAIPKDIEAMGISIDDFVSGVNKSLLKIPPVAQTASNAFENFGDTLNQLRTTIGNMALPAVTRQTGAWSDRISQLNEMLMPANERLEAMGSRISTMTTNFKAQNTETETLITRYGEIQTALADANIDTEESERLHGELLEVVKSLKEQLPGLVGLWGDEGGSIEEANGALARRLELQKRLVRDQFTAELKKSARAFKMQSLSIGRAEERIDAYRKAINTFSQQLGGKKLAGFTFEDFEEDPKARRRFEEALERWKGDTTLASQTLKELRKGQKLGLTVGDLLGGNIQEEEGKIQATRDSMAQLSLALENLIRVSGDVEVGRFERLISTFDEAKTDSQLAGWNRELETLATNLGLNKKVLADFIRLASELPEPKAPVVKPKGKSEAELALEAKDRAAKQKKADEDATKAREEAKARQMQGEADRRAEQEMLRKLAVKLEKEIEAEKVEEAKKTQAELEKLKAKQERDAKREAKAADEAREAYNKYWKDKRVAMQAEIELSNALQLARNKTHEEGIASKQIDFRESEAEISAMERRQKEADDRIAANARKGREAEAHFEQESLRDGQRAFEEAAQRRHDQMLGWIYDISQVSDAFADLGASLGVGSELQQNLNDISEAMHGFARLASGDMVGGFITIGNVVFDMLGGFKKLKLDEIKKQAFSLWDMISTGMMESPFSEIREEAEGLTKALKELSQGRILGFDEEKVDPKILAQHLESYIKEFDGLEQEFTNRQEQIRGQAQGLGEAVLDGIRAGFSGVNLAGTEEAIVTSIDKMLLDSILQASLMNEQIQPSMDKLAVKTVQAFRDGFLTQAEAEGLSSLRDDIARSSKYALEQARGQANALGIDAEKIFPSKAGPEEDRKTPGLSVAIRNITTRQADTLTRVLRGQMSLLSQVAGNTLRSAMALETYLPSVSNTLEQNQGRPAAEQVTSFNRQSNLIDSYFQQQAAMGGA